MYTNLAQRRQDGGTAVFIEIIGRLVPLLHFHRSAIRIDPGESGSKHIVTPVDGAGMVPMQMRPIAGKSDEVPQ